MKCNTCIRMYFEKKMLNSNVKVMQRFVLKKVRNFTLITMVMVTAEIKYSTYSFPNRRVNKLAVPMIDSILTLSKLETPKWVLLETGKTQLKYPILQHLPVYTLFAKPTAIFRERTTILGPRCEKTCLWGFVNNTGADQPAHPRSLISAFVIRFFKLS